MSLKRTRQLSEPPLTNTASAVPSHLEPSPDPISKQAKFIPDAHRHYHYNSTNGTNTLNGNANSNNITPAEEGNTRVLLCTLPPTCHPPHNQPVQLTSSMELERHYAQYHAHVCEQRGCAAVFPDERLLELHHTECHDPIAAVRRERGEKIFACHIPTCPKKFSTPKNRRNHLIQSHYYPKEFFFAVTNKGVGGLLKKWGEGVSLVRPLWRGRHPDDSDDSDDGEASDMEMEPQLEPAANGHNGLRRQDMGSGQTATSAQSDGVDAVISSLDALSLVPTSIRFGRGAKSGRMLRGGTQHQGPARPHVQGNGTSPSNGGKPRERSTSGSDTDAQIQATPRIRAQPLSTSTSSESKSSGPPPPANTEPASINIDGAIDAILNSADIMRPSSRLSSSPERIPRARNTKIMNQELHSGAFNGRGRGRGRGRGGPSGPRGRGRGRPGVLFEP